MRLHLRRAYGERVKGKEKVPILAGWMQCGDLRFQFRRRPLRLSNCLLLLVVTSLRFRSY